MTGGIAMAIAYSH